MNYPLIPDYVAAIELAEYNFSTHNNLKPMLDDAGNPIMRYGDSSVVFKMKDTLTDKCFAVKCFLKEHETRSEAYHMIENEINHNSSNFLTHITYLDKELRVDDIDQNENLFPVLLMDWIEGQTISTYLKEHINDDYGLSLLIYSFSRLAIWLNSQPFAHGNLMPDNIIVREDGTLVLVDYDSMYVPAMGYESPIDLGSPDYYYYASRVYGKDMVHIDDFALTSILLSLKIISMQPGRLLCTNNYSRLLFTEQDYLDLSRCGILKAVFPSDNDELNIIYSLFLLSHSGIQLTEHHLNSLSIVEDHLHKRAEAYCRGTQSRTNAYWTQIFDAWELPIASNEEKAYALFKDLADRGCKDAQCCMGCILWKQLSGEDRIKDALYWYRMAADNGDDRAIRHIRDKGWSLFIDKDYLNAFKLFNVAADHGDDRAKAMVAFCYENGFGVTSDIITAGKLYNSIENGSIVYEIGQRYLRGDIIDVDYKKAVLFFERAVLLGEKAAYAFLAITHLYSEENHSKDKAFELLIEQSSTDGLLDVLKYLFNKNLYQQCVDFLPIIFSRFSPEEFSLPIEDRPCDLISAQRYKERLKKLGYHADFIME